MKTIYLHNGIKNLDENKLKEYKFILVIDTFGEHFNFSIPPKLLKRGEEIVCEDIVDNFHGRFLFAIKNGYKYLISSQLLELKD